MPTKNWKADDLAKIRKMRSSAAGKKASDALKKLKKSASDAKKSAGELGKMMKDEGEN
tara:strand:- start:838 stop:1011 length:174 start_codon:yes stop_codon:yes gene_type:complete